MKSLWYLLGYGLWGYLSVAPLGENIVDVSVDGNIICIVCLV